MEFGHVVHVYLTINGDWIILNFYRIRMERNLLKYKREHGLKQWHTFQTWRTYRWKLCKVCYEDNRFEFDFVSILKSETSFKCLFCWLYDILKFLSSSFFFEVTKVSFKNDCIRIIEFYYIKKYLNFLVKPTFFLDVPTYIAIWAFRIR